MEYQKLDEDLDLQQEQDYTELASIIKSEMDDAQDFSEELGQERSENTDYYLGEEPSDTSELQSEYVSTDVREAVLHILPSIMRVFFGTKKVVDFVPTSEEDVPLAEQQTNYINYIINQKNNGFQVFYNAFKDALIRKAGFVKAYYDDGLQVTNHTYTGLSEIQKDALILDPNLTLDLSPRLTAATGMDALAHNLEAFCAPGFHPMADGIAIEGMKLIKNSLIKAVKNGKDLNARAELLASASMGSTAFQKGLGAIHSLSHPINAQFNVHHGLSNAIFMPYVLTFNKDMIEKRIISICDYLELDKSFDSFLKWILELRKELNIPHKLSEIVDVNKINLEQLSVMALEDPSTSTNPRTMSKEDMKALYEHSISGKLF